MVIFRLGEVYSSFPGIKLFLILDLGDTMLLALELAMPLPLNV